MNASLFIILCSLVAVPLWCLGLRVVTDYREIPTAIRNQPLLKEKKLFWAVRRYFLRNWPIAGKPIITCVSCMPSFHTLPVMLTITIGVDGPVTLWLIPSVIFVAVASTFICSYWWSKLP